MGRTVLSLNSYHGFSTEDALAGAAKAGFKAVELCAVYGWTENLHYQMSDSELKKVLEQMADLGLSPVALSGHQELPQTDGISVFLKNMELAHRAGIPLIVTGVGEVQSASQEAQLFENLGKVAAKAEELNLQVGLEIHGNYLATGVKGNEIVQRVGSQRVRLNYDTGNVIFYGDVSPLVDLPRCLQNVLYVHLKDKKGGKGVWNFPAIGDGELSIESIRDVVKQAQYNGPVSIELEFTGEGNETLEDVNTAVEKSLKYMTSIDWVEV
ncbi:sugar phosphate isomerase/epimerase [Alicyclobacillus tolerans]|uniref:sugar phosphate isomerase/epimerase family protein n=1 Tax=Alicyclobacillus tolerans TaxID=90970 RepID=UPI001F382EB9|nr:sugar phosphate isomerase/epimerase family protein [Alicyclobacillus tolerans]MCF8566696.1 sugar phosphate isomerase/epimerase [Alicyclobacillus tolerans]